MDNKKLIQDTLFIINNMEIIYVSFYLLLYIFNINLPFHIIIVAAIVLMTHHALLYQVIIQKDVSGVTLYVICM